MSIAEDVQSNIDIVDVIERYVKLKKVGKNYSWLCPFHNEKSPSFTVAPDKQIFKCFGCGMWGDAIKFVMELDRLEFMDAIKLLADQAWMKLDDKILWSHSGDFKQKETYQQINKAALSFFHMKLLEDEKASEYIVKERKLSKEIIIKYKIGYAPSSYFEMTKYLKWKWFSDDMIIKTWLGKKSSTWEINSFFVNRIMFPIANKMWQPVAFSWRIFNSEEKVGKYINTPETALYQKSKILYWIHTIKDHIKEFDHIIVVEWFMDVIWLDRLWYPIGVATCGTAFTQQHAVILKRITENIIFSFDNDPAGYEATIRALKVCLSNQIYPKIFVLEECKDFDDAANIGTKIDIIWKSKDCLTYIITQIINKYDTTSPVQRTKMMNEIYDIILEIKDYLITWQYLDILWKKLWVDSNILYQQIKSKNKPKKQDTTIQKTKIWYSADKFVWAIFFQNFFKDYWSNDQIEENINSILELIWFLPDNIVSKVLLEKITDAEKAWLKDLQFQLEKNFEWLSKDVVLTEISTRTRAWIHQLKRQLVKRPDISNEEKQEILKK